MNFIFISPNFPANFWHFCDQLAIRGVNVLGIGDAPYDQLPRELKASLTEYYRVGNLGSYDETYKAVAYFAFKHGRIDWIESNNEHWLDIDARLRTDFRVTTGPACDPRLAGTPDAPGHPDILDIVTKSAMKERYAAGGVATAPYVPTTDGPEAALALGEKMGYPLIATPNAVTGSFSTRLLRTPEAVTAFFEELPTLPQPATAASPYLIEAYITGAICSYDAIYDAEGHPLFESATLYPPSMAEVVQHRLDTTYVTVSRLDPALRDAGRRTAEAYGLRSRFVHFEFFRLAFDHPGIGKEGDYVGLAANMRPGGGFVPDMINYLHDADVYCLWAEMILGRVVDPEVPAIPTDPASEACVAFAGLRDGVAYVHSRDEILTTYGSHICHETRVAPALAPAMGDQAYIARFATEAEKDEFLKFVTTRQ